MYVGTNSVAKLASFLRGYQYALEKQGLGRDGDFLAAFQEMAQSRYGVKTSKASEDISSFRVPMTMRRWSSSAPCDDDYCSRSQHRDTTENRDVAGDGCPSQAMGSHPPA